MRPTTSMSSTSVTRRASAIGDPDTTVSGQHRYTLAYTLPAAQLADGELAVDALAGDEFDTLAAEVVVRGFELADRHCFVGGFGSTDQCELRDEGEYYRADLGRLRAVHRASRSTARSSPSRPPPRSTRCRCPSGGRRTGCPSRPLSPCSARRSRCRSTAAPVAYGRNEVYAGGAADAAFGVLPVPSPDGSVAATTTGHARHRRRPARPRHHRVRATQGAPTVGGRGAAERAARRGRRPRRGSRGWPDARRSRSPRTATSSSSAAARSAASWPQPTQRCWPASSRSTIRTSPARTTRSSPRRGTPSAPCSASGSQRAAGGNGAHRASRPAAAALGWA